MDDAPEPARTTAKVVDPDDTPPAVRPVGTLLVGVALVFAAAAVASTAATAISYFETDSPYRFVDQVHLVALRGTNLLIAGLLVGAALLLVAAQFHDVESRWFPRAVGIVGGLGCLAVAAGVFVALDVPTWTQDENTLIALAPGFGASTSERVAAALDGVSVAAVAACAVAACWMLATGRMDFGRGSVDGDDPE